MLPVVALVAAWRDGAEVVRATRRTRAETGLRRLAFDLFHQTFGRLSDIPIDSNSGTFGLIGRDALAAFEQLPERHRFFPGLRAWIGFTTADVPYDRQERAAGQPQQTFRRLVRYALDGLFSFSHLPLRLLTYAGIFVALMGFAGGGAVAINFAVRHPERVSRLVLYGAFIQGKMKIKGNMAKAMKFTPDLLPKDAKL